MITTLTTALLSGVLSNANISTIETPYQGVQLSKQSEIPYRQPEPKPHASFPEHNKYFIRMEELNTGFRHAGLKEKPLCPQKIDAYSSTSSVVANYLTRHQTLRVTRENTHSSWQPNDAKPKKRKARVKNK